eukprot:2615018-Pyramimonas_sp.AAC.1
MKSHEHDEDEYPSKHVYGLWEELNAAWSEQLREKRRAMCLLLGTQHPRKEDLKLCALAPTGPGGQAAFKFPNVFDLDDPGGYYQIVCIPRNERELRKLFNRSLHGLGPKGPIRAGGAEGGDGQEPKHGQGARFPPRGGGREGRRREAV